MQLALHGNLFILKEINLTASSHGLVNLIYSRKNNLVGYSTPRSMIYINGVQLGTYAFVHVSWKRSENAAR